MHTLSRGIIRNAKLPSCLSCLHFIEHTNNYPYDPLPSNDQHGKCKQFGEVIFVTGEIEYDLARDCRADASKCGPVGSKYTKR